MKTFSFSEPRTTSAVNLRLRKNSEETKAIPTVSSKPLLEDNKDNRSSQYSGDSKVIELNPPSAKLQALIGQSYTFLQLTSLLLRIMPGKTLAEMLSMYNTLQLQTNIGITEEANDSRFGLSFLYEEDNDLELNSPQAKSRYCLLILLQIQTLSYITKEDNTSLLALDLLALYTSLSLSSPSTSSPPSKRYYLTFQDNNSQGLELLLQENIHTLLGKEFELDTFLYNNIEIILPKRITPAEIQRCADLLAKAGISTKIQPAISLGTRIIIPAGLQIHETLSSLNKKLTVLQEIQAKDSAPGCAP